MTRAREATMRLTVGGSPAEVPGAVTLQRVAEARQELGAMLAQCRELAGLRQKDLADRMHYVRSTIAGVETGRQATPRQFWEHADAELGADGVLVNAFEQVEALLTEHRAQRQADRRRARYAALLAELRRYADLAPDVCPYGCAPPTPQSTRGRGAISGHCERRPGSASPNSPPDSA